MCYTIKQTSDAVKLVNRFKVDFNNQIDYIQTDILLGFTFPLVPIIANTSPQMIQLFNWGLLPKWAKGKEFRKNTLNARIETIDEKPSFKSYTQNRCLILVDGFYEYQWLDTKGKLKQRYLMTMPDEEPFTLGGLWNNWTDKETGENINTFTILTIPANEQMEKIHNNGKRMPLILDRDNEFDWLSGKIEVKSVGLILNTYAL